MKIRHASLFSGIGGFDLAAEWMGWTNVFNCEWEEFPRQVLKHHFPNVKQHGDIKELDATAYAGRIDILTGGFPCQPYSVAGKREGKNDERHLWPEMLRVIRECSPKYVVGENVRGITSWNGGLVFEEVCSDLEAEGYEVQPFILPACGVQNAPHRRDRVWFVAHSNDKGTGQKLGRVSEPDEKVQERNEDSELSNTGLQPSTDSDGIRLEHRSEQRGLGEGEEEARIKPSESAETDGCFQHASDASSQFMERRHGGRENGRGKPTKRAESFGVPRGWEEFPTFPPICGGDDGLPRVLDGLTFSKWRQESIKAYGNAIVPHIAFQIFKAIQLMEDMSE
jgi:DNA (cytosine-5)-methyltransferase 1